MSQDQRSPDLLEHSVKLKTFLMLRQTRDAKVLVANIDAHLRWMIEAESRGQIFLSGPVASGDGATRLDGLTVIRAADLAAATLLAEEDPFVKIGAVSYELREWTINEGSISVTVSLSDSGVTFH